MRFHVRVGILPHERELPQPLEIDLRVRLAPAAPALDYRVLYGAVSDVVSREPHDYLEGIAGVVLDGVASLAGVTWARVAIRKPHVMLAGPLAFAEIVMEAGA